MARALHLRPLHLAILLNFLVISSLFKAQQQSQQPSRHLFWPPLGVCCRALPCILYSAFRILHQHLFCSLFC